MTLGCSLKTINSKGIERYLIITLARFNLTLVKIKTYNVYCYINSTSPLGRNRNNAWKKLMNKIIILLSSTLVRK
jgi:hypothetical protein